MMQSPELHSPFRYALIGVSFFLALIVMLVFILFFFEKNSQTETQVVIDEKGPSAPVSRTLSGTVVFIDPAGEYMRVAVSGEGVFSVGVAGLSEITADGKRVNLLDIEPMSVITLATKVSLDTSRFDYEVQEGTAVVATSNLNNRTELSVEERVERLRQLTPDSTAQ